MKTTISIVCLSFGLSIPSFSQVVLELGSNSLINPEIDGITRATLNAIGTIVDPDDIETALSTVNFSIELEDGIDSGDSTFFDNGRSMSMGEIFSWTLSMAQQISQSKN